MPLRTISSFSTARRFNAIRSCSCALLLLGCSGDGDQTWVGDQAEPALELGTLELHLAAAPAGTACLNLTFEGGGRDELRQLALTPGQPVNTTFKALPVGLVQVDAKAYDEQCRTVTLADEPSWVLRAPEVVRIQRGAVAEVSLELIQNGAAKVSIDWESPAWLSPGKQPVTLAVIGDTPYGADQIADHPNLMAQINSDSRLSRLIHLGDIKNGSSRCDNEYFQLISNDYTALKIPLVYTPGDNEWTDCHRANNGGYDPLERLQRVRQVFFPTPGLTLGAFGEVLSQAEIAGFETYRENALWYEAGVAFATVHVVGSNNSSVAWYTDDVTGTKHDDPARRNAERSARIAAGLAWIDQTFELARGQNAAGVVLAMQADTFADGASSGFTQTIQQLAAQARSFAKPVLLLQGDTHVLLTDKPLENGHTGYGVTEPLPNLSRVVVQQTTREYLRLTVDPALPAVFSWERVQF